jgi:hypothetical protein
MNDKNPNNTNNDENINDSTQVNSTIPPVVEPTIKPKSKKWMIIVIIIGVLLGKINISIGSFSFSPGLTGGVLFSGLMLDRSLSESVFIICYCNPQASIV